jgi:hypothetical protein
MRRRVLFVAGVTALIATGAALLALPAVTSASSSLRFSVIPNRVVAGRQVSVTVALPATASARCSLSVRYHDGKAQSGLAPVVALSGRASWTWVVGDTAAAGAARVTASCGKFGRISHAMLIVGSLIPPKINVEKSGFSIRPRFTGTNVSWGLVLRNTSPNADALQVYVLVNFVLADGRALGTQTANVTAIGAGSRFYVGGELSFPGAAPIARLEPVIVIGGHERKKAVFPAITNVVVEPNQGDPGWVGDVAGELVNDNPPWILNSASLFAVVFDAAGNVLGGGSGSAGAKSPPGTRQVFKISGGFDPIPVDKTAYAIVSSMPSYSLGG